jgi:hypothetical protein
MHPIDLQLNEMLHGNFEEGWKISEKLQSLGEDKIPDKTGNPNPEMWLRHSFNRGWFLLQQGKYQEGSQLLESGRFLNVYGSGKLNTDKPLWNGQDSLEGKTIIISMEGGYGDEIIHARFATSFARRGAEVLIACDPSLHSVFERIPGVKRCITRAQPQEFHHDYWLPGFSCGWVLGYEYDTLPNDPYIFSKPESVQIWKNLIKDEKPKIGIRWSGNPKFEHQQFRLFDAKYLTDLSKYDELKLYSLQRDNDLRELPPEIYDLQHLLISWEDTVAAIEALDLVITSCTSIAHIAGAMGKETWVVLPILPYHIWAKGAPETNTSPWYKNVKLFRQKTFGKWDDTFEELYAALRTKYNLRENKMMLDNEVKNTGTVVATSEEVAEMVEKGRKIREKIDYTPFDTKTRIPHLQVKPVFLAGLPMAGQDSLLEILYSHPEMVVSEEGYDYYSALMKMYKKLDILGEEKIEFLLKSNMIHYYNMTYDDFRRHDAEVVLDVNLNWNSIYDINPEIFGKDFKMIAMVRNPADILASFEVASRKHRIGFKENGFIDRILGTSIAHEKDKIGPTILEDRCYKLATSNGIMGRHHALLTNNIITGKKDHILFVEYNKFFNEPQKQLDRICEFIGVSPYKINTEFLEKRREKFVTVDILGLDLFHQYNNPTQIFWRDWI